MSNTRASRAQESRLRRVAQRQGLRLVKVPTRDPRALGYGRYLLYAPLEEQGPRGLDLDQVDEYLGGDSCYGHPL